ncbi:MAG: adenylate kinase [Prevotellaceae bacterium]|jgi:adenylate kinase|nr:adenylate kinase [Prevotellaceae bacterium]
MLNIVLFGPPGAGKGTVAKKIADRENLIHLSTGDMLREEVKRGSALGREAGLLIDRGLLVPDDVVVVMVREFIKRHMPCPGFIFDGFPRTTEQAAELDAIMAAQGTTVTVMIALQVRDDEIIRRMLSRAEIEGRPDDTIDVIRKRIATYHEKIKITGEYYKKQNKYRTVDSSLTPDNTLRQILSITDTGAGHGKNL